MEKHYLEMMRAHVDEGGQLSHRNGLDLLAEVERQNTALDSLTARVKELEESAKGQLVVVNTAIAERERADRNRDMWKGQCERQAAELSRLQQERDEAMERCAKVAESFAPATQDMMSTTISDYCDSIAAAIRQLASGPEGGEKPQEPTS